MPETDAACRSVVAQLEALGISELHVLVNNSGASWGEALERTSGKLNWG